jgi:hypothetical protein
MKNIRFWHGDREARAGGASDSPAQVSSG